MERSILHWVCVCALVALPLTGCSDETTATGGSGGSGDTRGDGGTGGMGGDGATGGTGGAVAELAFASDNFERLELSQGAGLGYCPEDQMVISATIVRGAQGAARIEELAP